MVRQLVQAADFREAYLETLLRTERLPKDELNRYQAELVGRFFRHAAVHVPFYRDRLPAADIEPGSSAWLALPTIDRSTLANHGEALRAVGLPEGVREAEATSSGGSSGRPVRIEQSNLEALSRVTVTYRMFSAYEMAPELPLFMIRNRQFAAGWTDALVFRKWSYPWLPEAQLGDRIHLDIDLPTAEQLDRLNERSPAYANTLPSQILRLGLESRHRANRPSIPVLAAVAEHLAPEVARLAADLFGSRVVNILTSSEAGPIAIECPASGMLHVQSERLLAEVLDPDGRPCAAGEVGEVVVTPFYNYAMPLVRYRTGDYVVQGGDCPCGRSLPAIERFAGRQDHMFRFPDGSHRMPQIDRVRISELIGHDAWQLVQTQSAQAELRYEPSAGASDVTEELRENLRDVAVHGLAIKLIEVASVPKTGGGKRHYCINMTAH